uniref:non-specific serine/threonine protein kinase n=1 Tax=Arcella intermedia TaxID=1963864 RepID=A0A6B2L689_9EUKA
MNKGSYGIIYKGKVPGIKQTVVIKDILLKDSLRSVEEWRIEVTNMARANSPYITIIHGYSVTDTVLAIVMEFIERGDLYTLMHKGKVHFPPFQRLTFALQITLGIAHLHKMDILHRDVKTMNILLTREGVCKLTDFGTAKTLQEQQIFNTGSTGTPLWMAPEVPSGVYHFPADIYSLGVVLYEVFQERLPDWDKKNNRVVLMPNFSTQNLVLGCLKEKPAERISMIYLLRELKKMGDKALKTMEINFASFRHEAMQVPNYRDLDKSFSDISPSPSPRGNDELTLHRSTPNLSRGSLGTLKVDVRKVSELKKGPEKIPEGNESKDSDWNIKISDAENVSLTELENLLNWWCANVDSSKELREQTESQWTQLFGTEEERKQLYSMDENNY